MTYSISHWSGRLGNNIQQTANCILAAKKHQGLFQQNLDHDIISKFSISFGPKQGGFSGRFFAWKSLVHCEKNINVTPILPKPSILDKNNLFSENYIIPDLKKLGLKKIDHDDRSAFIFLGGTKEGEKWIDDYFWKTNHLSNYKLTRNGLVGKYYSSRLSTWLSNGSLSSKMINLFYDQSMEVELQVYRLHIKI